MEKKHKCDKCLVEECDTRKVVMNPKYLENDKEVLKGMIDKYCNEFEGE